MQLMGNSVQAAYHRPINVNQATALPVKRTGHPDAAAALIGFGIAAANHGGTPPGRRAPGCVQAL
jgi:hypothetical protein